MNEILILSVFLVIGYSAGVLIGMLGIGGGLVFVPTLYYLLPFYNISGSELIYYSIGTSLFAGAIATSGSGILHLKNNNVNLSMAALIGFSCVITAFTTPYFVTKINSVILEIIFAIIFLIVASKMFFEKPDQRLHLPVKPLKNSLLIPLGLFAGVFAAFTGLGGGIIFVPVLTYLFIVEMKKAIGTSAFVTAITMICSAISYLFITPVFDGTSGFVHLTAGIILGLGAVAGGFLGVKILSRSSPMILKRIFSIVLVLAAAGAVIGLMIK